MTLPPAISRQFPITWMAALLPKTGHASKRACGKSRIAFLSSESRFPVRFIDSSGIALLGGIVRLQLVANPGAFLSMGAQLPEVVRQLVLIGATPPRPRFSVRSHRVAASRSPKGSPT